MKLIEFPKQEKPEGRCTSEQRPSGLKVDNRGYNGGVEKRRAKIIPFSSRQGRPSQYPETFAEVLVQASAFQLSFAGQASELLHHGIPTCSSQTLYLPTRKRLRNSTGGNSLLCSL